MTKVYPEVVLDPNNLLKTNEGQSSDSTPVPKVTTTHELPKPLADFKSYIESKFCYHTSALETATLLNVQSKVAYRYEIKLFLETRNIHWKETTATWNHNKIIGSETLGRWIEGTTRNGEDIGNIWDYHFDIPTSDGKSKSEQVLPQCAYLTRCSRCDGKGLETCPAFGCNGTGKTRCSQCDGTARIPMLNGFKTCDCGNGEVRCSKCKGGGKVHCEKCSGYGGFRHTPTIQAKWCSRKNVQYVQNSFLPPKRIEKAQRSYFWSKMDEPWADNSSIEEFVSSLQQDDISERIPLKTNLIQEYYSQSGQLGDSKIRRLSFFVDLLNFEEVQYNLDEKYVNKKYSQLGNTFRFCQYPVENKGQIIYEDDYPLNCCGCFGDTCACYSSCCTIL